MGKVGHTVSTFHPAAGNNSPVDGQVQRSIGTNETFVEITAGAGTDVFPTGASMNVALTAAGVTDGYNTYRRGISLYNTAIIGTDYVNSAVPDE